MCCKRLERPIASLFKRRNVKLLTHELSRTETLACANLMPDYKNYNVQGRGQKPHVQKLHGQKHNGQKPQKTKDPG